jgi:hypothetical protein
MIAAWMAYSLIVSAVLLIGGTAGEYVARALGWATRLVWAGAIVAASVAAGFSLAHRAQVDPRPGAPVRTDHWSTITASPDDLTMTHHGSPTPEAITAPARSDQALAAAWRACSGSRCIAR